jgi:hypothetical protein
MTRETGDAVLITDGTRAQLSETMEVESRGRSEIRGYDREVELFAPLVPEAIAPGVGGSEVAEPLGDPTVGGLGRAPVAADGLGKRAGAGLGRPSSGGRGGRSHTLPGG